MTDNSEQLAFPNMPDPLTARKRAEKFLEPGEQLTPDAPVLNPVLGLALFGHTDADGNPQAGSVVAVSESDVTYASSNRHDAVWVDAVVPDDETYDDDEPAEDQTAEMAAILQHFGTSEG